MILIAVSTLGIVLIVLAVVILLLAAGGYAAATRRAQVRRGRAAQRARRGPSASSPRPTPATRAGIPRSSRPPPVDAATERFGDATVGDPLLVQVLDRPGTDADQAVFLIKTADGGEHRMTLGRAGGVWGPA